MKRGLIYPLMFLFCLSIAYASYPNITCTSSFQSSCPSGYDTLLNVDDYNNSHVELANWSNYGLDVCCNISNTTWEWSLDEGNEVIRLFYQNNSHVSNTSTDAYTIHLKMNPLYGQVICGTTYGTNCTESGYDTCVFKMNATNNTHISSCEYENYSMYQCCSYGFGYDITRPDWDDYELTTPTGMVIESGENSGDTIVQIRDASNNKKVEFVLESIANIEQVTVESDWAKTAIANWSTVTGTNPYHSIFIPNIGDGGTYVCPEAQILDHVNTSCTNIGYFTHQECQANTLKGIGSDIVGCSIDSAGYKIWNLTGSGGGANEARVPEFSDYALILGITITLAGLFVVRKKR